MGVTGESEEWWWTDTDAADGAATVFLATFAAGTAFTYARLVDDGTVFEAAEVEHADAAISAAACKDVDTAAHEAYVIHLLVMGDQLCFSRQRGDVPDGAGGVDAACDDQTRADGVPIQTGQWCGEVGALAV